MCDELCDIRFHLLLHPGMGAEYCDQFVSLRVCLSACISLEPLDRSSRNLLWTSPVAVALSASGGIAISYVLPVLWAMSTFGHSGPYGDAWKAGPLTYYRKS